MMRVPRPLNRPRLTILAAMALHPLLVSKYAAADPASRSVVGQQAEEHSAVAAPGPLAHAALAHVSAADTRTVMVRSGNHVGFGRLAIDFLGHADASVEQDGDTITVHLNAALAPNVSAVSLPRNVRAIATGPNTITISLAAGGVVRSEKSASQLVIDVLDPVIASKEGSATDRTGTVGKPNLARARSDSRAVVSTAPSLPPDRTVLERIMPEPPLLGTAAALPTPSTPDTIESTGTTASGRAGSGVDRGSSDLGASEPPVGTARNAPTIPVATPVPVSTNRTPPAGTLSTPAGLPNAVSRPASPPVVAAIPTPNIPPQNPVSPQSGTEHAVPPAPGGQTSPFEAPGVSRSDTGQTEQAADDDNPNAPAWAIPPTPASQPVQTTVNQVPVAPDSHGAAIMLPFTRTTGAAALRRGDDVIVVFDENRPIDLAPLHGDPVFGSASIQLLESATLLRVHLLPNNDLRLAKVPLGWNVWIGPRGDVMDTPLQTLGSSVAASQMQFAASQPSKVVVIPDPDTGGNLLVGTQHTAGESVPVRRRTPDFDVVPSLQGVVIAPTSDRPQLQVAPPGFVLAGVDRPLALSDNTTTGTALADAATLTRRFNIQPLPLLILRQTLQNRIDEAAATPPLARLAKRRATAEAYIGLGMGAEAQAMMRLAVMDDPRGNDDPDTLALGAMGAILAGRNDAAEAINDPRLTGTDEIKFWRAVHLAQKQADSKAAAIDFADTDRLALAYPDLLRDALLPLVAETEVLGGQVGAAAALLDKRKDDARLLLARAFLLRAKGDTAGALAVFDKLALSRDRLLRFRASVAAIDLRLTSKKITATEAADAAEKLLFAWRGDDRERDLRFQVAAWRFQAGQWSAALAMLRESAESFPERRNQYRRQITETLRGLMRDDRLSKMDSIQLISLLEDNKELLPDGAEGQLAAVEMADRMAQLDLDERALPLLERLAKTTPSLPARAAFGLRLASLYLAAGDAKATQTALSESGSAGLGPELVERRDILAARADAVSGNVASAVAALTAIGSVAADLARADIEETAKDWPGAETALTSYVSRTVPPEGTLAPEQGHSILRLAAAMAQAGDEAGLGALRTQYGARMQETPDAATFRLLTEAPVRDVTDLPRSAKELAAARTGVAVPTRQ